eukprot:CAMPEP_0183708732 /NCGR_PEP_ID=MMETSP0737-20130205/4938_1 /TAXON_ID=385413 /ORGANISM="Thalassiosira miniscula, Strain CCMP1093" /LENGTH=1678 /DNA_ID=CAMNT_0025936651 /DNA_START=186 /DNA_END=5222 /DNA_ORIENTATION=-
MNREAKNSKRMEDDVVVMKKEIRQLQATMLQMKQFVEAHLPSASNNKVASASNSSGTNKRKEKNHKRKKGGSDNSKVPAKWFHRDFMKITVALVSGAMLTLLSLGGNNFQASASEKIDEEQVVLLKVEEKLLADDDKMNLPVQRITLENTNPPSSIDSSPALRDDLYYPVWVTDGSGSYCDNALSKRPSNYNQLDYTLFETPEECCDHWFGHLEFHDCIAKYVTQDSGPPTKVPIVSSMPSTPPPKSPRPTQTFSTAPVNNSDAPTTVGTSSPTSHPSDFPTDTPTYKLTDFLTESDNFDDDPENCGCEQLRQADYRGFHDTDTKGNKCELWDAEWVKDAFKEDEGDEWEEMYTDMDLEGNYCRNPDGDVRTWCYTEGGSDPIRDWEYCDVPYCDVQYCASSLQLQQKQFSPLAPKLDSEAICNADPETCTCPSLNQETDYRGTISTNRFGGECERWDAEWVQEMFMDPYFYDDKLGFLGMHGEVDLLMEMYLPSYTNNIILEGNYCRNPDGDHSPWCFTRGGGSSTYDWEYCNVPSCPHLYPWCTKPGKDCGCLDKEQIDYRGNSNQTRYGEACITWSDDFVDEYPEAGLGEKDSDGKFVPNNYCRNPTNEYYAWCLTDIEGNGDYCGVPPCDDRTCMPSCGSPNYSTSGCTSVLQVEECCENDDTSCKCNLLKDACRRSLENGMEDFCDDAVAACHDGSNDPNHFCSVYEEICSGFPGQFACDTAAEKCCRMGVTFWENSACYCDFHTFTSSHVGFEHGLKSTRCKEAEFEFAVLTKLDLDTFYHRTGGDHWFNNSGWLSDNVPECQWFGLKCNGNEVITEINLRNNNLTGTKAISYLRHPGLVKLDLAGNNLSGGISSGEALFFRKLVHIDVSNNEFGGCADMTFSPGMLYANFSHNKFTCVSFKRYNAAYETQRVVDISHNLIHQDASEIFRNIPPNLEEMILSDNNIQGKFPDPFPSFNNIRHFNVANNSITGPLPDFSRATPWIREIDLSNQRQSQNKGLTGEISPNLSRLQDLRVLNLSFNSLTSFPSDLGNLPKLELFDISSNLISQTIPSEIGNLAGTLEILDLSNNRLKEWIPKSFANFETNNMTSIYLRNNTGLFKPAPLMLCFLPTFDFADDEESCPSERNALKDFFNSAKGLDWTNKKMWLDPYASHCSWHGVDCSSSNATTTLNLTNNGLSGTLSKNIAGLASLEVLDLSDNDIKGSVTSEIGKLTELVSLRLSYNQLTGALPNQITSLKNLKLIQLNDNRIQGTLPIFNWKEKKYSSKEEEYSSFIADCGNPSDFDVSLGCEECTMCCNAQGNCYPQEKTDIQKVNFENYSQFTVVFFACIIGVALVAAILLFFYDKYNNRYLPRESVRDASFVEKDNKRALVAIGSDSSYSFFLGKSWVGWIIALVIAAVQLAMLFIFVEGAEIELWKDSVDVKYTWRCPRDEIECKNTADLNEWGWAAFAFLMATHLLKDIINGSKMILLSSKERQTWNDRIRFFCGGLVLNFVALFTLYVSTIYNKAIATSNTEIVMNSIVILFITDTDEQLYDIFNVIDSSWVARMSGISQDNNIDDNLVGDLMKQNADLQDEVNNLKTKVNGQESRLENICQQMDKMQKMMDSKGLPFASQSRSKSLSGTSIGSNGLSLSTKSAAAIASYDTIQLNAPDEIEESMRYKDIYARAKELL